MMVADMVAEDAKPGEDEIIVTKENMVGLYGKWLAQRRRFALLNGEYEVEGS